nr:Gag-Pol polyprotein [Tanacetum cinerariifolium]
MIVDSIENGTYVRRMISTLGEPDLPVLVPESFHEQTDEELTETDIKRMDADDQAIQTILLGLPEDVYAAVDSCETAKEIWERVRQMMKGSDIGEHEKKAKLFNERESLQNIASNLKFLNNLQPEWKRHVTIVRQTKNLHETDFTQIYDFLKMNQEEVNELRAERLAKSHDPLALMAYSPNSFNFPITHKDQSSSSTHPQQSFPINNKYNPQPPMNQNFMQPPMTSLEDINDPTEAMNATLILFAKAFQLSVPTNNNQRTSSNPPNRQITQLNQQGFNAWQNGGIQGAQNAGVQSGGNQNGLVVVPRIANQSGTGNVVAARAEGQEEGMLLIFILRCSLLKRKKQGFNFKLKNLTSRLLQASTSGTQHDRAPVYDTDGSAKNDNHVTSVAPSMVQSGGTVETSSVPNEEIRAHQETMTLLLSKNQKTMSSECNNIKLAVHNDKSEIVCANCKQCLVTAIHDACLTPSVNVLNSRSNKLCANVPRSANQRRHRTQVWKPKQVGSKESLAPKPRLPRFSLKWSPSGRSFDLKGKLVASNETNFPNDDKACTSNLQEPMRKRFPNSSVFLGRLSKFVCGETLASLEIWMVLTCSKAIVLQISTSSISMTWPQLLPYV